MHLFSRRWWVVVAAILCVTFMSAPGRAEAPPRYVILMVADGAGFNTFLASEMWRGTVGRDYYHGEGWVKLAASTHALRPGNKPMPGEEGLKQDPSIAYDPAKAWDATPVDGAGGSYPYFFRGYQWLRQTAPDSANTGSAIVNGVKSYNNAINVDGNGKPVPNVARAAKELGMAAGVVSSVPMSHATPAAASGAQNVSRNNYAQIAADMLSGAVMDVIIGCGHPDFDENGKPRAADAKRDYKYVGGEETWKQLKAGTHPVGWVLKESLADIEAALNAPAPAKLLVVPQVGETLQQRRSSSGDTKRTSPGDDALTPGLPSLTTMARLAIHALERNEKGFFLMIEGGAVDWANHSNQTGRMIEEMEQYHAAVQAVVQWVDARQAWDRTLLIVTADHDHVVWGPESDTKPFAPLQDNGKGKLPGVRWLGNGHGNSVVPVYARGTGAEALKSMVRGQDPVRGPYIDQTDLATAMRRSLRPVAAAP